MEMTLNLTQEIDWSDFVINFIPEKLLNYILLNLNEDRAFSLDEYLDKNLNIEMSSRDIIEYGLSNLFVSNINDAYIIKVDSNLLVPESDKNLLSTMKLLDYGNLEVRGLNIISEGFSYIVMQLINLVALYRLTRRGGKIYGS